MYEEGEDGPVFIAVNDPFVLRISRSSPENRANYASAIDLQHAAVLVGLDPSSGDYIVFRPKDVNGMEKATYWKVRQANEKIQSAYFDMDDAPQEIRDDMKLISKRLEELLPRINGLCV
jgi:hypothetical protein